MHEDSNPVVVAGVENNDSRLFAVMPHLAIWGVVAYSTGHH
jgi:hypothetical protein